MFPETAHSFKEKCIVLWESLLFTEARDSSSLSWRNSWFGIILITLLYKFGVHMNLEASKLCSENVALTLTGRLYDICQVSVLASQHIFCTV